MSNLDSPPSPNRTKRLPPFSIYCFSASNYTKNKKINSKWYDFVICYSKLLKTHFDCKCFSSKMLLIISILSLCGSRNMNWYHTNLINPFTITFLPRESPEQHISSPISQNDLLYYKIQKEGILKENWKLLRKTMELEFDQRNLHRRGVDIFWNHTIYQYLSMSQFSMLNILVLDITSAQH